MHIIRQELGIKLQNSHWPRIQTCQMYFCGGLGWQVVLQLYSHCIQHLFRLSIIVVVPLEEETDADGRVSSQGFFFIMKVSQLDESMPSSHLFPDWPTNSICDTIYNVECLNLFTTNHQKLFAIYLESTDLLPICSIIFATRILKYQFLQSHMLSICN